MEGKKEVEAKERRSVEERGGREGKRREKLKRIDLSDTLYGLKKLLNYHHEYRFMI